MAANGEVQAKTTALATSAIDVGFASIGRRHGESSSQAESRSSGRSSEKRSSVGRKQEDEPQVTPRDQTMRRSEEPSSTGSLERRTRDSGGFLLDSAFANGSPKGPRISLDAHGKRKAQDGPLRVDKRRAAGHSRLSGESSLRSSPLSREVPAVDGPADEGDSQPGSRPPSMDASQLVQMALNLNEVRKRHVSNTLHVPPPAGRRVTSAPMSNMGTVKARSASARQRSSQLSDDPSRDSPTSNRAGDESVDRLEEAIPAIDTTPDNVFYTFSPATLARAERARKYFELANEHRRLLQHLPALTADAAPPLGRSYNPIQSLRNRRIRIREKRPFTATPDTWADPEKVKGWVDEVEAATAYYGDDNEEVQLPRFDGEHEVAQADSRPTQNASRHRRTDTVGSVITRPENSWTVDPTELLADAYWTESANNKAYIESREGHHVFPHHHRKSMDTPKISVEMHHGRHDDPEPVEDDDFEVSGRPSRRRKLLLPLVGKDRPRHRRISSRASSSSSGSSRDRRGSRGLTNRSSENVGPLEKHMQELIEQDAKGELSSPELISPDHWNSRFRAMPAPRSSVDKSHGTADRLRRDTLSRPEGRSSLEVPSAGDFHRRSKSADGRVGSVDHSASSADEASEPASPQITRNVPSMGMDLSPESSHRKSLDENRTKSWRLPHFRSQSKERNSIEQTDFADGSGSSIVPNILSPIFSTGSSHQTKSSQEDFKRQGTSDSLSTLRRNDTGSTYGTIGSIKESGSTVGRFLRGRRDRIFKTKEKMDAAGLSELSDTSDVEGPSELNSQVKRRATDDSDASPRTSLERARPKPKFHLSNLPSFTSSARDKRLQAETPNSTNSDPFNRQAKRPERFDRLAPPRLNLSQNGSSPELTADVHEHFGGRKSYGQLQPLFGEIPRHSLMPGVPTPGISQAKRHWSIYDIAQPEKDVKITSRDVARVRALLLSSGIKAREIQRVADNPRSPASALMTKASATASKPLPTVAYKDESVTAAQMLSSAISAELAEFETTLSRFQNTTAMTLSSQLDDLRQRAADQLSNTVHDTSDEADAFTVELTTRGPQQTKRVDDAVDEMLRRRRRQLRLFRLAGFKLLEWLVVAILWWIWFLVIIINTGKSVFVFVWRLVSWLCSV